MTLVGRIRRATLPGTVPGNLPSPLLAPLWCRTSSETASPCNLGSRGTGPGAFPYDLLLSDWRYRPKHAIQVFFLILLCIIDWRCHPYPQRPTFGAGLGKAPPAAAGDG